MSAGEMAGLRCVRARWAKTPADKTLMAEALKNNANLCQIFTLDDAKIKAIIDLMWTALI